MKKPVRVLIFALAFAFTAGSLLHSQTPISADPREVLSWPIDTWRDRRYEVFRWDVFPEVLIFDTATYAVQDNLFKRLAFFVEKKGYRGRLMRDEEIASLHGWNAHDYRARDLAVFFETARRNNFPLLREERELESILVSAGVLRRNSMGEILPGRGAVISLSRESDRVDRSLRPRFMAHEGFHALYFIDDDFQHFSRQRWEAFPAQAKRFLLSYFDFQNYDIDDTDLVIKEFKAHILQFPVSQMSWYFGQHLPNQMIARSPQRRADIPQRQETRDGRPFWPELAQVFTAEAEVFSRYVNQRWGLAAGRVWRN